MTCWPEIPRRARLGLLCTTLLIIFSASCEPNGTDRFHVSGTVTHNGAPVPKGYIVFEPDTTKGNRGPGAGANIDDGRYATARGKGIVGGPHVVRIHGTDGVAVELPGEGVDPYGTPLFTDYLEYVDFPHGNTRRDFDVPPNAE